MNDTRAKLETLFRRLVDPTVSDLEALSDFVWFRKLALDAKDVQDALGTPPGAPVNAFAVVPGAAHAPSEPVKEAPATYAHANEVIRFGRYSAKNRPDGVGWTWARVVREDRKYLEFILNAPPKEGYKPMPEETKRMIREALGTTKGATTK